MFNYDYIYIVENPNGYVVGVFKKIENAFDCVPEKIRNEKKVQVNEFKWHFGSPPWIWTVTQYKIKDSDNL